MINIKPIDVLLTTINSYSRDFNEGILESYLDVVKSFRPNKKLATEVSKSLHIENEELVVTLIKSLKNN